MTGEDTERALDAAFERLLLDAARRDAPPEGAQREAWARFATIAGSAAVGAGVGVDGSTLVRAVHRAGARWFAIGALSGGVLTAGWMASTRSPVTSSMVPSTLQSAEPVRAASSSVSEAVPAPRSSSREESSRPPVERQGSSRRVEKVVRSTGSTAPPSSSAQSSSTLAREIEALDAVQGSLTRRDFARAFELAERYPKAFPAGQLEAEAAALAIEALAGQGNHAEAKRRALTFLRRYPNDPHRARVAAIADR